MNEFQRLYRTQSVCPFVCPSVCLSVCLSVRLSVRLSVQIRDLLIFLFVWHWLTIFGITMRRCVAYIHDPNTTLTFDLNIKFIVLCSGHSLFVLWYSHTMLGMWVYHHGTCTMCRVHSWPLYDLDLWPQYQNYISPWISIWQDRLCSMKKAYILDLCMTLTFDLYVGSGGILIKFYSQFLSS